VCNGVYRVMKCIYIQNERNELESKTNSGIATW
jgi:hypothetical protein